VTEHSWLLVSGFGAHIKSTREKLIIQQKNENKEYSLDEVKNLLIVGGHTLSSTTVAHLIHNGVFISFFEPNGNPVGIIRPFGDRSHEEIHEMQREVARYRYATAIAEGSIRSRILAIESTQEIRNVKLLYEGELEFLYKAREEIPYLIKLDEIRRLHKLTTDMYYEIMSRSMHHDLGFRRRTIRPQSDPVNAMLSFGYATLFGNCCVSVIGARFDPDIGLMSEGKGSLVYDLIEPMKSVMIDPVVFQIARESLTPSDFEQTPTRCILSDNLMKNLIKSFHKSIALDKIEEQITNLYNAMTEGSEFKVVN
jgi:CRISPR-associated endonuclease Cas1